MSSLLLSKASGSVSLLIFGTAISLARKGIIQGASTVQRRLLVSLEVPSRDRAHSWLLAWMDEQARRQHLASQSGGQRRGEWIKDGLHLAGFAGSAPRPVKIISRDLAVITSTAAASGPTAAQQEAAAYQSGGPLPSSQPQATNTRPTRSTFSLVPGPGTHFFRYRNVWLRLVRERHGKLIDVTTGAPWETLTLTTLHSCRSVLPALLAEAEQMAASKVEGKTTVYTAWGVEWRAFGNPRKARRLESVVLQRGQKERLVGDIQAFLGRGEWYAKRGIPYRRGYLLHGSPGSGKTSIISALAGELDLNICLLNLSERGLTDDKLNHLLSMAPERSIILLEDIDAAFPSRSPPSSDGAEQSSAATKRPGVSSSVTFSGLLNALDGIASSESRLVVMTTNHVEALDPALIRPGRVDLIEELGDADETMAGDLFERFYGQVGKLVSFKDRLENAVRAVNQLRRKELGLDATGRYAAGSEKLTENIEAHDSVTSRRQQRSKATRRPAAKGGVSMAELQGLFIRYPDEAVEAVRELEDEAGVVVPEAA
ncbi:hypothetical protein BDZ90DRAFT_265378 [Jaminaea rosea]|uniref:P-loop containing nucleoside triphosphate hydrolase protein n=1 Tax=Jaminaea rosea TaxID=1569628 RepID=A0A316UKB5_9BASI|nr:hypothetical protein BDZ90DRAFT_265378 [Jaminaea rosea]PWN25742.1 hypothetical protein BDZ90DRAFT_265378 [Jaminaea rosea]